MQLPSLNPKIPLVAFGILCIIGGIFIINNSCGILAAGLTALTIVVGETWQRK